MGQNYAGETSSEEEMIIKKKRTKHKRKKNQEAKKLPETIGGQKPNPSAKEEKPGKGSAN